MLLPLCLYTHYCLHPTNAVCDSIQAIAEPKSVEGCNSLVLCAINLTNSSDLAGSRLPPTTARPPCGRKKDRRRQGFSRRVCGKPLLPNPQMPGPQTGLLSCILSQKNPIPKGISTSKSGHPKKYLKLVSSGPQTLNPKPQNPSSPKP